MLLDTIEPVNDKTFGVEIEVYGYSRSAVVRALTDAGINAQDESYNHHTRGWWKVTYDGSIQDNEGNRRIGNDDIGVEIVSPVLSGAEGLRQVRVVVTALKALGVKVNKTCGLHVHHDASHLDVPKMRNLLKRYIKAENVLDRLMSLDRRQSNNGYIKSPLNPVTGMTRTEWTTRSDMFARLDRARTIQGIRNAAQGACSECRDTLSRNRCTCGNRYAKVNLNNFWRTGTVEFRHANSTLNADRVVAWVVLTQSLIELADKGTSLNAEEYDADRFFHTLQYGGKCPADAVKYLKRKMVQIDTTTTIEGAFRLATL